MEGLALKKLEDKNHFFLTGQLFSFAIVYTGMVILGRNISVLCSYRSYCGQEYTQGGAHTLRWRMFPPAVLAGEAFWNVTLIAPWVASEASKVLMVRS